MGVLHDAPVDLAGVRIGEGDQHAVEIRRRGLQRDAILEPRHRLEREVGLTQRGRVEPVLQPDEGVLSGIVESGREHADDLVP